MSKRWNKKDTTVSSGIKSYQVASSGKNKNTKNTDNDNDNDIGNDSDNDIDNNIYISSEQQVATEPKTVQMKKK